MEPIKNIKVVQKKDCCGCASCYNSCPVNAIVMKLDSEGFQYPSVNEETCTSCGLCQLSCPTLDPQYHNNPQPDCYAVLASDELREKSSSGGMFSVLADYVLSQKGYVCGAAYGKDLKVEHIIINTSDELQRLRGSKYVQSNIGTVYRKIKQLLREDQWVLFSGCPCQVAGLNAYLRKDYEKLVTVDLVCHGVPSPLIFERYLKEEFDQPVKKVNFRPKDFGYICTSGIIETTDGSEIVINPQNDIYEQGFHSSLFLRKFCEECKFAEIPRQGDFTIGDFWGISQYNPQLNDNKGTSLVLINSKKAKNIFDCVIENTKHHEAVPLDYALKNNRFTSKIKTNPGRQHFFDLAKYNPLRKAFNYAVRNKYDVGIMGLWFGRNYGSVATYYALHQVIRSMNLSVLMIDNPLRPSVENINTKTHPRRFGKEYYQISKVYPINQLKELNKYCDTFIVGSDQLWNYHLSRPYGQAYFLGFVENNRKKIAYGTSFGKEEYNGPDSQKILTRQNLKRFDAISVREDYAVSICENTFGVEAVKVLDPVFLCEPEEYDKLLENVTQKENNYIGAYILDPNTDKKEVLKYVSGKLNKEVNVILDEAPEIWDENKKRLNLDEKDSMIHVKKEVDLKEWLSYLKNSDFIITDSFHGCCFAILFRKPFIGIKNNKRGGMRFHSLLSRYGLLDRLVSEPTEIYDNEKLFQSIDYEKVYKIIIEDRKVSFKWLKDAIFSPKETKNFTAYPIIDERLNDK